MVGARSRGRNEAGPEGIDLGPQLLRSGVVTDDELAPAALDFQGELSALAALKGLSIPAALGGHAGEPDLGRRLDEGDAVAEVVPPGLIQDGGVEHDRRRVALADGAVDGPLERPAHPGVEDCLQVVPGRRVLEDDGPEGLAVDRTVGPEDLAAESGQDQIAGRALLQESVPDGIGVEDQGAAGGEFGGHEALAGADAADQPEDRDGPVFPGTSGSAGAGGAAGVAGHSRWV